MGTEIGRQIAAHLESCIARKSLRNGQFLHARLLRSALSNDTFLSNRLIEFYSKCGRLGSARNVFDKMPKRDIYSWNAMLSATCSANKLSDARELFDGMPERNAVSFNNVISALVKGGYALQALEFYVMMISEGLVPTHFTLASVLSACGMVLDADFGRKCHGTSVKVGIDHNMYVGNALLAMYAKCRHTRDALMVFQELREPDEVSFTAMMSGLAKTKDVEDALEMFRLMHRSKICIDAVSLSSVLGLCAKEADHGGDGFSCKVRGLLVHSLALKLGFEGDFHLSNSILDMYAKSGDLKSAEIVFQNLPKVSNISWNIMIAGYGQNYQVEKAIELMHKMECSGFEPDEVTFINMLAGCVKSGGIITGRQVFDRMVCPSLSSWNAMLSGYSQVEKHKEGIVLFREMQFRNIKPDRTTLAIILRSCSDMGILENGRQVHAVVQKGLFHTDMYVGSGLITLYSKTGKMDQAKRIFERLPELDIVCWNSMIAGFTFNSLEKEAFGFFNMMRERNLSPTQFSYASLLSCCAESSSSFQGRQMHAQMLKDGFINDVFVGSPLIGMYSKCGDVNGARRLFDSLPFRSTVTWNEMIHGYAQNGNGNDAVSLYNSMIKSHQTPDAITFMAVLTACSHAGLVDEAIEILETMRASHDIEPCLDHYTCVIDGLARAGRVHEAEMMVSRMGCEDDPVIWEVLLSSCRFHGNVDVAKRAAEKLFGLNARNHTAYVLLANVYSAMGRWEEAKAVREVMSDKCVIKEPGFSWVENVHGPEAFGSDEPCSYGTQENSRRNRGKVRLFTEAPSSHFNP